MLGCRKGVVGGGEGGGEGTLQRVGASSPLMWRNGPDSPSQVQGSMRLRGGLTVSIISNPTLERAQAAKGRRQLICMPFF